MKCTHNLNGPVRGIANKTNKRRPRPESSPAGGKQYTGTGRDATKAEAEEVDNCQIINFWAFAAFSDLAGPNLSVGRCLPSSPFIDRIRAVWFYP